MPSLHYVVDARDGREHRFRVSLEIDRGARNAVDLFLPVWTPGSYLIREHQRHVGGVRARDAANGAPIAWHKTAKNRYRFEPPPGCTRLHVDYEVFAHELTVRTADLTEEHAFWNGVNLFLWPTDARDAEATVDVLLPAGWRLFSALPATREGSGVRLTARGLDQLADSPALACADPVVFEFEAMGKPHRFVFDGMAGVELPADLVGDTRAVIEQAARVFGLSSLPYDRYDFLVLAADKGHGGLEHADSSVLLVPRTGLATTKGYRDFLGLVAHEHFHVFNVKRMRPAELWQVDYGAENHTTLLWVAEGFTAYYDDLLCRRAGVLPVARYLQIVADNIADALRTPGRLVHSLAQASYDAWIKFYRPDEDSKNSSQSYYVDGGLAAMCIDLEIRRRTDGRRSLDDAMAHLWRSTWCVGRGFTEADVVEAISIAADADLGSFVRALVDGPFDPDFAAALRPFGLVLAAAEPSAETPPFLGIQLQSGTTTIQSALRDGPAVRGGLSAGDEILALGGLRVGASTFDDVLRAVGRAGKPLTALVARRGRVITREVIPGAPSQRGGCTLEVAPDSTPRQDALRRGWLGADQPRRE
ncbi:MAG TPA: peptidase M61 [Planctomycetota bacterium]|nr:peptidase M61 [Planctomycetota bacterium]